MSNILQFSISEALSLLEKKEFSTKELVETYINAIEKTKDLNMYLTTCFDEALEQAKISDKNFTCLLFIKFLFYFFSFLFYHVPSKKKK